MHGGKTYKFTYSFITVSSLIHVNLDQLLTTIASITLFIKRISDKQMYTSSLGTGIYSMHTDCYWRSLIRIGNREIDYFSNLQVGLSG